MMKKNGTIPGLAILLFLFVALLIAFLLMQNMGSVKKTSDGTQPKEDYVQQAQDLVDQINQAQQQAATSP